MVKLSYKHLIAEQPNRCKIRAISSCVESDLGFIISSALLCSVIGLENLRHFLNQTFSRASNSLLGFFNSYWLVIFDFVLIGSCEYFGFSSPTPIPNALYNKRNVGGVP